ncbi:transposase [Blautia coccoides]|uniref:Transposase n=2 Tax=Blautia TaxID=572511 RepID=A0ABQ0BKS3_9FIRM|nr:transposase [Blautia coccoides]MCQ4640917.1 transposase [Blautia coccoides]
MNEAKVFADGFQISFAEEKELLGFLHNRSQTSKWMRKPTKELQLVPIEKLRQTKAAIGDTEVLSDTEKNTQLMLKTKEAYYPVRDCAIKTILNRAGISGSGLNRLDKKNYARVINMCLQTAKGVSLIRVADSKISAIHGGDYCDYKILDTEAIFRETILHLEKEFPGFRYIPESGSYDHTTVTAMWELTGQPELVKLYQEALDAHKVSQKIYAPALRLSTSDVAAKSVTLYPMLLCEGNNQTINLGHPIRLQHRGDSDIQKFRIQLQQLYTRYKDAVTNIMELLDIEIKYPVNCFIGIMKELRIGKKIGSRALELYVAQHGEGPATAHQLYYALNEAVFFAACNGIQGTRLLKLEEQITKALTYDWEQYDLFGTVSW